jgi:hypothetical protein
MPRQSTLLQEGKPKLSSKSTTCVLLCTLNRINYLLYDLKARKVLTRRNVLFTENVFLAKSANTPGESDLEDAPSDSSSGSNMYRIVVTGDSESDDSSSSDSSYSQDLDVSSTTSEDTENEQSSRSDSESEDTESAEQISEHDVDIC